MNTIVQNFSPPNHSLPNFASFKSYISRQKELSKKKKISQEKKQKPVHFKKWRFDF